MIRQLLNHLFPKRILNVNDKFPTEELERIKLLLGKLLTNSINLESSFIKSEFSIFSQWGDDGLIQFVIKRLGIKNGFFVEFGVENYFESNTRFLLMNDNWSGLVMDGSQYNIDSITKNSYFWRYDLTAKCAFITAENINTLLIENIGNKKVDLLHIDIDGNDYWVWKAINVVFPKVVIVEYNSVFGSNRAITIPYKSDFNRSDAHYSNLYFGASLEALILLATDKGYDFIGCNSAGNNAYFIRKDCSTLINESLTNRFYVESKFRESRDEKGHLNFPENIKRKDLIKGLMVYNVRDDKMEKF